MPRGVYKRRQSDAAAPAAPAPTPTPVNGTLEMVFDDMRAMLEARRSEFQASADRISDILATLAPAPKTGRPAKR